MGVTKRSAGESKERREWHSQVATKDVAKGAWSHHPGAAVMNGKTASLEALSCVRCGRVSGTLERASGDSVLEGELV